MVNGAIIIIIIIIAGTFSPKDMYLSNYVC